MRAFLKGSKTYLRSVDLATDIPIIASWINDGVVTKFMFYGQLPTTLPQVAKMIEDQIASPANVVFMVCDNETQKPIGFAGLYDMHRTARKAEFRILIGETDFWGKGYGTEVAQMLTFYGFDRMNMHRMYLGVTSENLGGVKAYEKAGYVREGQLRDDIYRNSRYYDSIKMSLLRNEYYEKYYEQHKAMFTEG
jgi:RimJ/RimL family protein N-acetyltransferase